MRNAHDGTLTRRPSGLPLFEVTVLALACATFACKGDSEKVTTSAEPDAAAGGTVEAIVGAGDEGADGGGVHEPPRIFAIASPSPVLTTTEFPPRDPAKAAEAQKEGIARLGYLRKGTSVVVKPNVIRKKNCAEGWYELVEGGFVCGKYATLDPQHKELEGAPHPPFDDRPLPYDYGLNITNGTPLYRRKPLRKERTESERGLAVGKTKRDADGKVIKSAEAQAMAKGKDAPWYVKSHEGKPQVTFDDLKGETGLIVLRMMRGFYLALDTEVRPHAGKMWRTTDGYYAPADHILVHKPTTEFQGVWVGKDEEPRKLPLGFVLSTRAWRYQYDDAEKKVTRSENVDRFTVVALTGKRGVVEDRNYYETTEGWWMRDIDGQIVRGGTPPADLKPGEKWIDVNLKTQSLVAYEGEKPVYATIVSTGRHHDTDKSQDHRTITGDFRIREKHVSDTMDDDGGSDGAYSIQDVPWIMYFQGSYALHGAFWHSAFGRERSHGCVNMTPHDAKIVFQWAGPKLPTGWHGVRATDGNPGTRVIVHE